MRRLRPLFSAPVSKISIQGAGSFDKSVDRTLRRRRFFGISEKRGLTCKTVYPGSIPGVASNKINHLETKHSGYLRLGDPPVTHTAGGKCSTHHKERIARSALSRRNLVTSAAALPALAVPAVAVAALAEPDPIYAAIEKYRIAEDAFLARCEYEDDLEKAGQKLTLAPDDHRTPEMVAAVKAAVDARQALAKTSPTTIAGLSAILDFVVAEGERLDEPLFCEEVFEDRIFIASIARTAAALAVQS
jgi:hypothetical protein